MKILFLDNDFRRHVTFAQNMIGKPYKAVHTYEEAVCELAKEKWDLVYLDNDLSENAERGYPAPDEKMGLHVADFIIALPPDKRPAQVIVHSWNRFYRAQIFENLRAAGIPVTVEAFSKRTGI